MPIMATLRSDPLDISLQNSPMNVDIECQLISEFWGLTVSAGNFRHGDLDFRSYFTWYREKCNSALREGGTHTSVRTHRDLVEIAQWFQQLSSRDDIKNKLKARFTSQHSNEDELVNSSIDLVTRLYLMLDFGVIQSGFTGREFSKWISGDIKTFIADYYKNSPKLEHKGIKLQEGFNARNLGRITRIKIDWTKNLTDHLRLVDDDKTVAIFHHRSFLEAQKNNTIYPDGFIQETLNTIALLFPPEPKTKQWFGKLSRSGEYDIKALSPRLQMEDRQIENFVFWHDRLVILKGFFDEAEPSTLSEWWYDRRKKVQWYTFWVAAVVLILTVFFGLVQSVEGGMQVWKAFNP